MNANRKNGHYNTRMTASEGHARARHVPSVELLLYGLRQRMMQHSWGSKRRTAKTAYLVAGRCLHASVSPPSSLKNHTDGFVESILGISGGSFFQQYSDQESSRTKQGCCQEKTRVVLIVNNQCYECTPRARSATVILDTTFWAKHQQGTN